MVNPLPSSVEEAREAALDVLLHNVRQRSNRLPRTAGWGYPEPYTRDLMLSAFGFLVSGSKELVGALGRTLEALAAGQSPLGHIASIADDPQDRGASDTTVLFLIGLHLYRRETDTPDFLEEAAKKALTWMRYQSPDDLVMVAQLPTSDWRDEQWVLGYGLYVNALLYLALRQYGDNAAADQLAKLMHRLDLRRDRRRYHAHEGLRIPGKPYFAMCSYKLTHDERFDLLGNSLAILTGIAAPERAANIIHWVESECRLLRESGALAVDLPPCLIPFIQPSDPDWRPRYEQFNQPGCYHNGGIWPFICGFYVAACGAAGRWTLAREKLLALTDLVKPPREHPVAWGFNEWCRAHSGEPAGCDWQTWSAALYLYAVACVEQRTTPFLEVRTHA